MKLLSKCAAILPYMFQLTGQNRTYCFSCILIFDDTFRFLAVKFSLLHKLLLLREHTDLQSSSDI